MLICSNGKHSGKVRCGLVWLTLYLAINGLAFCEFEEHAAVNLYANVTKTLCWFQWLDVGF